MKRSERLRFVRSLSKAIHTHLSKRPSDFNQNGTQEKTPFSSTVFHALSHGVIRFVASVSSKNHLLTGWNSLTANQGASIQRFLKLALATKRSTPCQSVWKTVPENGVFSCVPFSLRSLWPFAKCDGLNVASISNFFIFYIAYCWGTVFDLSTDISTQDKRYWFPHNHEARRRQWQKIFQNY